MDARTARRCSAEVSRVIRQLRRVQAAAELRVRTKDGTWTVDLASLYMTCGRIREMIDDLARWTPRTKGRQVSDRIGCVWAVVSHIGEYQRHLSGPLDRLHTEALRSSERGTSKAGRRQR